MKKVKTLIILNLVLAIILSSFAFSSCGLVKTYCTVEYIVEEGGTLEGKAVQRVVKGHDSKEITVTVDEGYNFLYWDDGGTDLNRYEANVTKNITVTAVFERITFECNYYAGEHGSIEGATSQTVTYGENPETVKAIPDEGYKFTGWSDGVETAERNDTNVLKNISATATFGQIEKTFTVNYKLGEAENKIDKINLVYGKLDTVSLPVPQREHFTFGGWYSEDIQVADINGKITAGDEVFDLESDELYAKWIANETFTYKILLVYVTEIEATLPNRWQTEMVDVRYKMSDYEEEIAHELTRRVKLKFDELLDGLVEFVVDEYFTTAPVREDSFIQAIVEDGITISNALDPYWIEEARDKLSDYQTILSVFSLNDPDQQLHSGSGSASARRGEINFDSTFSSLYSNREPDCDFYFLDWDRAIETFIHETIHTIEMRINRIAYHEAMSYYHKMGVKDDFYIQKLYFFNQAEYEGQKVGIPYEFWGEDKPYEF